MLGRRNLLLVCMALVDLASLLGLINTVQLGGETMYVRGFAFLPRREGAPLFVRVWVREGVCVGLPLLGGSPGVWAGRRRASSFQVSRVSDGRPVVNVFGVNCVRRAIRLVFSSIYSTFGSGLSFSKLAWLAVVS